MRNQIYPLCCVALLGKVIKAIGWRGILAAGLTLWLGASLTAQEVGLARHRRIFVVPRPATVVIDGKLDDWDLSGQIWMFVLQSTADMQGAKIALMYDREALYVSGEVRDPTPLLNRHDPRVNPEMSWDADVCQLRLHLDPQAPYPYQNRPGKPNDQLITANLWCFTERKEPCLWIGSGEDLVAPLPRPAWPKGVAPTDAYQAAYAVMPDGKGYTLEYRIPWRTLGSKTIPKAGDILSATVQFNWSDATGLHTAGGSAWAYDIMTGSGFTFQNSAVWGKAIFSAEGKLSKEIVEEGVPPLPPAPIKFSYTLPRDAQVTIALVNEEGRYVRHLVCQGERRQGAVSEMWDGLDDRGQPLPPGRYTWKGIHHDPIETRHLLSVHNSGRPPYPTTDGSGAWGADHSDPTTVCAAGDRLLLAWYGGEAGCGLIRTDLAGTKQWGIREGGTDVATDGRTIFMAQGDKVRAFSMENGRPLNFGNGERFLEIPRGGSNEPAVVTGLAYADGRLYVSYKARNLVAVCDAARGTIERRHTLPAPGRLAMRPNGKLGVISAGKVAVVDLRGLGGAMRDAETIANHLDDPRGLAADTNGILYVSNGGALQNVSVFDAGGKYLRSIGKPGGRPQIGDYNPAGMLEPGGLAVDAQGKIWVAETLDSPRRISVWSTADGSLLKEFFGGSEYATFVSMNPAIEDEVYCHNVIWRVDLDKGTWYPKSTYWRSTAPGRPAPPSRQAGVGPPSRFLTAKNGEQYAWWWPPSTLAIRRGNVFKPFLLAWRNSPTNAAAWQDANDDQTIQPEEWTVARGDVSFCWLDADLNLYSTASWYAPIKIEAGGRPIYDFTQPTNIPLRAGSGHYNQGLFVDPQDGSFYTPFGPGFSRWTRDGKCLWNYPKVTEWQASLNKPIAKPGEIYGVTEILGVAGDFTGLATYFGPFNLLTRDGLFVARCFKDGRLGEAGPDTICAEAFCGQLVRLEKSGRYLFLGGDTDGRVTEILGLNTIQRFEGSYELTPEDAARAQAAQKEYARLKTRASALFIVRGREGLNTAQGVTRVVDNARRFTARVAYDREYLYVSYDVASPSELINSHADPRTIFKGGNALDLQFAANPQADPKRATPVPGDVRILVTRQPAASVTSTGSPPAAATIATQPVAVVYRPKIERFGGQPIVLTSPANRESFDSIEVSNTVKLLEYRKTPSGFHALVAVPLAVLGWAPRSGAAVRMDLGYLFGNATGNQCAQRAYWANNSFTANVTGDIPHESRLEPAEWGVATVE